MHKSLQQLVSELPEIYQTIYGHTEWSAGVSRDCFDRLTVIGGVYDHLSKTLGRPLRVLDLGCAQGFFSLSLAARGATVRGVDFLEQNIHVCHALAAEHPDLDATFVKGRIEDVIAALQPDEFDLVIGLSVFHHIVHLYGVEQVQIWVKRLADHTQAMILELALRSEPLYWGPSQPEDPRNVIGKCAFFHQIGKFNTHLSEIYRPMYVVSNRRLILGEHCEGFDHWRDYPYNGAAGAHKGSRRYYFGKGFVCKVFNYNIIGGDVLPAENTRNQRELEGETAFLMQPPAGFHAPACLGSGQGENDGWLLMECIPGELLLDILSRGISFDREYVLSSLLRQLVILEQAGLYHDDVRTWNILVGEDDEARLIDFGSIHDVKRDCAWPHDLFESFFILVNEIFNPQPVKITLMRPFASTPFNLPEPLSNWLHAMWQTSTGQWSFALLEELFLRRQSLPSPDSNGMTRWMASIEQGLQLYQVHLHHKDADYERFKLETVASLTKFQNLNKDIQHLGKELRTALDEIQQQKNTIKELREQVGLLNVVVHQTDGDSVSHQRQMEYIQSLTQSRSWRMTAPYRYVGNQIILLKRYGLIQRCKHAIRRLLKSLFFRIQKHPILKARLVNLLHKTGGHRLALNLYRRVYPQSAAVDDIQQVVAEQLVKAELEKQLDDLDSVPVVVQDIFRQFKENDKR